MKILFLSVLTFFIHFNGHSQTSQKVLGDYFWNISVLMKECDINGNLIVPNSTALSKSKQKFKVISQTGTDIVLKILDYTSKSGNYNIFGNQKSGAASAMVYTPSANFFTYNFSGTQAAYNALSMAQANSRNYNAAQKYFKVKREILDDYAIKYSTIGVGLTTGVLNLPFRARIQTGEEDFTGLFNLNGAIGAKFKHKSYRSFTYSVLFSYGISSIILDSTSVTRNDNNLSATNNLTALTLALGFMIEYEKVQAGIFLGADHLSKLNQNTYGWKYQGKPWVSVGFGYAIFSSEKEKKTKGQDQSQ